MGTPAEWVTGYARQARADFDTFQSLQGNPAIPKCHKLLFLQMACEKLCKAHLIKGGAPPESLQSSHGYIAKPLPGIIRQQLTFEGKGKGMEGVMVLANHLASEIELLNPAVRRAGQRPDNCEYPWDDASGVFQSPLDWSFTPLQLLTVRHGPGILKRILTAIDNLL